MITLTVTQPNGEINEIYIPTSWNDVTWQDYVELLNTLVNPEAGELHAAAILCGTTYEGICDMPARLWPAIQEALRFTETPPTPEPYKSDFEFTDCNLRQIEHVKDLLKTGDLHPYTNAALITSIILLPTTGTPYDANGLRIAKDAAITLNLEPAPKMIGMVSFFLNKSISFAHAGLKSKDALTQPKNLPQALRIWNSTVPLLGFMDLQKAI